MKTSNPQPLSLSVVSNIKSIILLKVCLFILCFCAFQSAKAQLNGNYTINPSAAASATNYKEFTSVVADLDSGKRYDGGTPNGVGVSGPVIIKAADGTYTDNINLKGITGLSATNTLSFTSASGDSSKVVISNNNSSVVDIQSLGYISFSKMSFTGNENRIIELDNSNNIIISSCRLIGQNSGVLLLYKLDNQTTGNIHSNCRFENNVLVHGYQGILTQMYYNYMDSGLVVKDNIIDDVTYMGIYITAQVNLVLTGNKIATLDTAVRPDEGIIVHGSRITEISFNIANGIWHGMYIDDEYPNTYGPIPVYNNVASGDYVGMKLESIRDINFNFNTCVRKSQTRLYNGDQECALFIVANALNAQNNNLVAMSGQAMNIRATAITTLDYNNYYTFTNDSLIMESYPVLHNWNGTSLGTWQTTSSYDLNSINANPNFLDIYYFKPGNNLLIHGKSISGITTDVNNRQRNSNPTIGAYELVQPGDVWPGDANKDKIVDIYDVLNVGIAYNDTGAIRMGASTNWIAQPCDNWANSFTSGVNHKNADCNGDGIVDSSDLTVIALNNSKTHPKAPSVASGNPNDPPLTIKFSKDSVLAGDTVLVAVSLGSSTIPVSNVYGLALKISNASVLGAKYIGANFNSTWLGTLNKNLVSLIINDLSNSSIDIGITRTDHKNVSGYGQVAVLSIIMPENLGGKREVRKYIDFNIESYKSISANEKDVPLNPIGDSVLAYEFKSGIATNILKSSQLHIYPNPANNVLYINTDNNRIRYIEITDMVGKIIYSTSSPSNISDIDINSLSKGMYVIDVTTDNGIARSKFVKE